MSAAKTTDTDSKRAAGKKSAEKKPRSKAATSSAAKSSKPASMSVSVMGIDGKSQGRISLPSEVFGIDINKTLIAQAVRVHLINQRAGNASTKTRSDVRGSTRKIWRQKGTGRARHGARTAPIFVGGGIAFGPKPKNIRRRMSKKMKRKALLSALSSQYKDGRIVFVDGLEKLDGKTKSYAQALKAMEAAKKTLVITHQRDENVLQGTRNIPHVEVCELRNMNTYDAISHNMLVMTKTAVQELKKTLVN